MQIESKIPKETCMYNMYTIIWSSNHELFCSVWVDLEER